MAPGKQLWQTCRGLRRISRQVAAEGLTDVPVPALAGLQRAVIRVNVTGAAGDVVECGVGRGGTGVMLARMMGEGRAYHGHDTFDAPRDRLSVSAAFARHGVPADGRSVALHRGEIPATLQPDRPVALLHVAVVDADLARLCLERVYPQLSVRGLIVLPSGRPWGETADALLEQTDDLAVYCRSPNIMLLRAG